MAVRRPLYQDSDGQLLGNIVLREMTTSQVNEWVNWFAGGVLEISYAGGDI